MWGARICFALALTEARPCNKPMSQRPAYCKATAARVTARPLAPPHENIHFALFQKGGTTTFSDWLPKRFTKRFPYGDSGTPTPDVPIYLNEVAFGAASLSRPRRQVVWIMREPGSRAWSEWKYRSKPGVEPTSLAKALPGDTWPTYTARHAEHHARHYGPKAVPCYCKQASVNACVAHPNRPTSYDCLWRLTKDEVRANAEFLVSQLQTYTVVGVLDRLPEAMVLLWHTGLLRDWLPKPCSPLQKNHHSRRVAEVKAPTPEVWKAWVKQHNPSDLMMYNATLVEFERRVREAEANATLRNWLEQARRTGEKGLPSCPRLKES